MSRRMKEFINHNSTLIEQYFYHTFLSKLIEIQCFKKNYKIEIISPLVDLDGYDIILNVNNKPLYIQLKSKYKKSSTKVVPISEKLFTKNFRFVFLFEYNLIEKFESSLKVFNLTGCNYEKYSKNKRNGFCNVNISKPDFSVESLDKLEKLLTFLEELYIEKNVLNRVGRE